jgi:hypothetical protein
MLSSNKLEQPIYNGNKFVFIIVTHSMNETYLFLTTKYVNFKTKTDELKLIFSLV